MRKRTFAIVLVAMSAVLNMVGSNLALFLKLPVYLDTLGTMVAGALLGPWYAICAGVVSGILTGITTDIYSLFFLPVQCVIGFLSGWVFRERRKGKKLPVLASVPIISVPGTFVAAVISAAVFGGGTSSGSTVLVQVFHHLGVHLTVSVFLVQFITDFFDKLIVFWAAMMVAKVVQKNFPQIMTEEKGGGRHGAL